MSSKDSNKMRFSSTQLPVRRPIDTLVLFVFEGKKRPEGLWHMLDKKLDQKFRLFVERENFKGKEGQTLVFYPSDNHPAKRVLIGGLGKQDKFEHEQLRRSCSSILERSTRLVKCPVLDVILPEDRKIPQRELIQAVVEGFGLAAYEFSKYRSKKGDETNKVEEVNFLGPDKGASRIGIQRGQLYTRGCCFARDLINEPASVMTPSRLAEIARRFGKYKGIKVKIYTERQMQKMGMGALLGVAAGSTQPPRFLHLMYRVPRARSTIALVGKGITFDSGGLCIKSADTMLHMKDDMSGAAAVLGIFSVISQLKPNFNIHGIIPATENMPGGRALKPGDVLRSMNNKSIEITNTDAEGRLILSDALAYASRLKPSQIIDLATLTGACVVALGTNISGLFATDQTLADRLIQAGKVEGEKLWQLPLEEEYFELLKSNIADMKNSGGRYGGAIIGAIFLKQFIPPKTPWAHIDIAGPCLVESAQSYKPAGGTGVMVRTLLRYLQDHAS
jgi:leucyl aminopeptidase